MATNDENVWGRLINHKIVFSRNGITPNDQFITLVHGVRCLDGNADFEKMATEGAEAFIAIIGNETSYLGKELFKYVKELMEQKRTEKAPQTIIPLKESTKTTDNTSKKRKIEG